MATEKSGRWGPYREASSHRPGTAPALGLRAWEMCRHCKREQTTIAKEIPMWLRSLLNALKTYPSRISGCRRPHPRLACHPCVEALEDRTVPSFAPAVNYPPGAYAVLAA